LFPARITKKVLSCSPIIRYKSFYERAFIEDVLDEYMHEELISVKLFIKKTKLP